jgi:zinc transport system permease protein
MTEIIALFSNTIFLWAVLGGIAASLIGGTVGSLVVVRRISFVSGSISHALLAGAGLFLWLERVWGIPYLTAFLGAIFSSIIAALLIARAGKSVRLREDAVIATIWATGMAIGIVFIAKTPGYTTELTALLIGNILWITQGEIALLFLLAFCCLLFTIRHFQKLKLFAFDSDEAKLQGIETDTLYKQLLILVAIGVVALTQVVGIVLVLTMLTLPQLLASLFVRTLSSMMIYSTIISILCTCGGLILAFLLDWPAGASITLLSAGAYVIGLLAHQNGK